MTYHAVLKPDKHTKTAADFSETELEELNHEYPSSCHRVSGKKT
jgi:hypothetical protein